MCRHRFATGSTCHCSLKWLDRNRLCFYCVMMTHFAENTIWSNGVLLHVYTGKRLASIWRHWLTAASLEQTRRNLMLFGNRFIWPSRLTHVHVQPDHTWLRRQAFHRQVAARCTTNRRYERYTCDVAQSSQLRQQITLRHIDYTVIVCCHVSIVLLLVIYRTVSIAFATWHHQINGALTILTSQLRCRANWLAINFATPLL